MAARIRSRPGPARRTLQAMKGAARSSSAFHAREHKAMNLFKIVPFPEATAAAVRQLRSDDWGNTDLTPKTANEKPGYPCRVCLQDAEPGEQVLLFSYS